MKKNKFKIMISILVCTLIIAVIIIAVIYKDNNEIPVYYSDGMKMFNTSIPEIAIGVSDYVFVCKINEILRTEYKNPIEFGTEIITTPYTIYSIDVIKNIKGSLDTSRPIEYMQYGGLNEDGKSYRFIEEGASLLEVGEYYILMAGTWLGDGGIIEVSDPDRIISLGKDFDITSESGLETVIKYEEAYKNEMVPSKEKGDIIDKVNHISKYDVNYISE